jgi:2-amino-4-hydroxy-6-hydroxymethyldihydropteridine diphosphokinase
MSAVAGKGTYIALGTNLPFDGLAGPALLTAALDRMADEGVKVVRRSSFWETAPWPPELAGQPAFVNAVAEVDPDGRDAPALYEALRRVEAAFGRTRRDRWEARTLDIDIIDFKGLAGAFGGLTLPHPRMAERAFVLGPLAELAPAWRHPVTGRTVQDLLNGLGSGEGGKGQEIKRLA